MLSHDRPMSEVLAPTRKDLKGEYEKGFVGMTEEPGELTALEATREEMIKLIVTDMPADHKKFLVSWESGEPEWKLLNVPGAADLPAVKWRKINLEKLTNERRAELVA